MTSKKENRKKRPGENKPTEMLRYKRNSCRRKERDKYAKASCGLVSRALEVWILVPGVPPAVCLGLPGNDSVAHLPFLRACVCGGEVRVGVRMLKGQTNHEVKKF